MRIDSRKGDRNWTMWHCELCQNIANKVVWVDVDFAQYAEYVQSGSRIIRLVQAKKIEVFAERKLILVNPVSDLDDEVRTYDAQTLERVS